MRLHRTCNQRSAKSRKQLNVISHQTIKGMRNLLEKYYNINFYCSYKLQFFIFRRMLNLFYWLSFSKWKNGYINRCISTNKRHEAAGMDKGVDVYISSMASNTPYIISIWAFCLVCLACIKIFRISLLSILGNGVYFLLLIPIGICGYYVNEIFLFKGGQIQEIFRRVCQKEKVSALLRHLCRFPDYTVSDILFIARQRMREYKLKSKNSYELYYSRKIGKSSYMDMEQVCEENCHSLQGN